jgi:hypothetical protein
MAPVEIMLSASLVAVPALRRVEPGQHFGAGVEHHHEVGPVADRGVAAEQHGPGTGPGGGVEPGPDVRRRARGGDANHQVFAAQRRVEGRQVRGGLRRVVLGAFDAVAQGRFAAREEGHDAARRDAESGRAFRRVEEPEASAGPGAQVDDPSARAQCRGRDLHRFRQGRQSAFDRGRHRGIRRVHGTDDPLGGESVEGRAGFGAALRWRQGVAGARRGDGGGHRSGQRFGAGSFEDGPVPAEGRRADGRLFEAFRDEPLEFHPVEKTAQQ